MEQDKRKKIEEKLRQMLAIENQSKDEKGLATIRHRGVRVIRRRKGAPDMQIA